MHIEGDIEATKRYYIYTSTDTSTATVSTTAKAKCIEEKFSGNVEGDFN